MADIKNRRCSFDALYAKREEALERVMTFWDERDGTEEECEEFDKALDVLAITHTMLTFEFATGSMSSSFDIKSKLKASDQGRHRKPVKPVH